MPFHMMTSAILLFAVLTGVLADRAPLASGEDYCVLPEASGDHVHSNSGPACHTLEFCLEHTWLCFRSNTTIKFLPGNYTLSTGPHSTPWISNITSLTLIGSGNVVPGPNGLPTEEPSSQIHCTGTAGFTFQNVSSLKIQSLAFIGCGGMSVYTKTYQYPALHFISVSDLSLYMVTVRNSTGWGVVLDDISGNSVISHSTFAKSSGTRQYRGGNIDMYYTDCPQDDRITSHLHIRSSNFTDGNYYLTNIELEYLSRKLYYAGGVSILIKCNNVELDFDHCSFIGNRGGKGGSLAITVRETSFVNPVKVRNCQFERGVAEFGAAVYLSAVELKYSTSSNCNHTNLLWVSNSTFLGNLAFQHGSGLYAYTSFNAINSSLCSGGTFSIENSIFDRNRKGYDSKTGGIVVHVVNYIPDYVQQGILKLLFKNCTFSNSYQYKSYHGFPMSSSASAAVFVDGTPYTGFEDCNFTDNNCTGIVGSSSNIVFTGQIGIERNQGIDGGGLVLCENSMMYLSPNTTVIFSRNQARYLGGAIHVESQCLQATPRCFFQPFVMGTLKAKIFLQSVSVQFHDNSAGVAGSALYGGLIDHCYLLKDDDELKSSMNVFNHIFQPNRSSNTSFISSDPIGVCFCTNGTPVCNQLTRKVHALPGQEFSVSVVVIGQRSGTVPGIVVAKPSQQLHVINSTNCTELRYTVFSSENQNITLSAQKYSSSILLESETFYHHNVIIQVRIEKCPFGFKYLNGSCTCAHSHLRCNITKYPVLKGIIHTQAHQWVGTCPTASNQLAIARYCPFDACVDGVADIVTSYSGLNTTDVDKQCAYNHSGTLCGGCTPGMSLSIGSKQCLQCSNAYIPVLLIFAVGGLLLVVVLTALNLTVTEGTINGLIFYANIVHSNAASFFPSPPSNSSLGVLASILRVFIAWLNLDMGIDTCFYNGLDAYAKTWTEFAFPIYIWVIAGVIVLLSRRYAIVARATGRHAVQVLATLFLLSFAKLLSIIIDTMRSKSIHCEQNGKVLVWGLDGHVMYLQGIHIPLFLAGLLASLILALPYGLTLIFVQCLLRLPCSLVWKLKPIFDAYTGPYKDVCRFWTGHLLLMRAVLLITSACAENAYPATNFLLILVVSLHLLLLSVWVFRGVYKKHLLDVLESSFIINLAILSITSMMDPHNPHSRLRSQAAYVSVAIALFTTVGIIHFHGYKQMKNFRPLRDFLDWLSRKNQPENPGFDQAPLLNDDESTAATDSEDSASLRLPTRALMIRFDQYREPVLGFEDSK